MLSCVNFVTTSLRPYTLRSAAASSNCQPVKEVLGCLKPQAYIVHYRFKSSNDNQSNAFTCQKENGHGRIRVAKEVLLSRLRPVSPNSRPVNKFLGLFKPQVHVVHYSSKSSSKSRSSNGNQSNAILSQEENEHGQITVAQKVKQTTKDAGYLGIVIAGVGVTCLMLYAIFRELFSGKSPNSVYSKALKLIRKDPSMVDTLGEPIKGYGEQTSRGRRRHVSHLKYEKDGKNYMRLKFYVEGTRRRGTVHLEMVEDDSSKFQYRYLFVDLDGYPKKTIILKDNRHLYVNIDNDQLNLLK